MSFYKQNIFSVIITKNYLVSTNNDSQVNLIHFSRPKKNIFDKLSRLDPKISVFDLTGPSGRRLEKKIHHNRSEDMVTILISFIIYSISFVKIFKFADNLDFNMVEINFK